MVRPGLRRSEIDWENVDIHISREEMEREQEHEAAIQQAKQYLIKNFPKFCTINNGYYETETFNHDAGMYEVMHVGSSRHPRTPTLSKRWTTRRNCARRAVLTMLT